MGEIYLRRHLPCSPVPFAPVPQFLNNNQCMCDATIRAQFPAPTRDNSFRRHDDPLVTISILQVGRLRPREVQKFSQDCSW